MFQEFGNQQVTVLKDVLELTVLLRHERGVPPGGRKDVPDLTASR